MGSLTNGASRIPLPNARDSHNDGNAVANPLINVLRFILRSLLVGSMYLLKEESLDYNLRRSAFNKNF
jgi:hypothetical protein